MCIRDRLASVAAIASARPSRSWVTERAAVSAAWRDSCSRSARRCRELHRDEASELRASLATLQSLFSQLSADQSLVHLRSGGGSTLGEYVRNAHKKLLRRARQEQEATSASSVSRGV